ncbi:MAG: carbohydrate kinase family protein [Desertimonas sp.]
MSPGGRPGSEDTQGEDTDLMLWGTVFLDIVFAGLPNGPAPGTEVWAEGMASCPGGIANLAVAARRLGLRTSLAAVFGDDVYGEFCWRTLAEQESVDLSRSRRCRDWHSPVTVSMSFRDDRAMVSHGHADPIDSDELIGDPPPTRSALVDLEHVFDRTARTARWPDWVATARRRGALVFADLGWDATGEWPVEMLNALDGCDAFLPNAGEAMAYTRTDTPRMALRVLADRVPLAVVTNGAVSALAIDAATGEEVEVPAVPSPVVDPTGAGDVFAAALVAGTLAGLPLADRLALGNLCSSLTLGHYGGSLAAPGWGDVLDWWHGLAAARHPNAAQRELLTRYEFLADVVAQAPDRISRRARATIANPVDDDLGLP